MTPNNMNPAAIVISVVAINTFIEYSSPVLSIVRPKYIIKNSQNNTKKPINIYEPFISFTS